MLAHLVCLNAAAHLAGACHRSLGAEGKDAAVKMFWDGRIKAFHTDRYEAGHRATNYKRWLEASRPYPIQ